jgi:membrane protease YdiL (CAAX protease family)
MTGTFPWRVFWLLFIAGIFGALASLPILSQLFLSNPEVRKAMPPLPLPILDCLLIAQFAVYLAIIIPVGLLLAQRFGFRLPLVTAWTSGERHAAAGKVFVAGMLSGLAVGVLIVALEAVVFLPHLPPPLLALDAGSIPMWKRLLAGIFYGGIVEELFFRLFLLTVFVWLISSVLRSPDRHPSAVTFWIANVLSALLFAAGHLPATSALAPLTTALVIRALVLNGALGLTCGYLFWRRGLESAIFAHMGFHLVWQVPGAWLIRMIG